MPFTPGQCGERASTEPLTHTLTLLLCLGHGPPTPQTDDWGCRFLRRTCVGITVLLVAAEREERGRRETCHLRGAHVPRRVFKYAADRKAWGRTHGAVGARGMLTPPTLTPSTASKQRGSLLLLLSHRRHSLPRAVVRVGAAVVVVRRNPSQRSNPPHTADSLAARLKGGRWTAVTRSPRPRESTALDQAATLLLPAPPRHCVCVAAPPGPPPPLSPSGQPAAAGEPRRQAAAERTRAPAGPERGSLELLKRHPCCPASPRSRA